MQCARQCDLLSREVTSAGLQLCGIAKDLTKLGGKTVTKLVTPDEKQTSLFKLVSFITGERWDGQS